MLNRQYSDNQFNQLWGMGAGLAGQAPRSTRTTGTTTGNTTNDSTTTMSGPGFLQNLAGNFGGLVQADGLTGGPLSQLFGKIFGGNKTYSPTGLE